MKKIFTLVLFVAAFGMFANAQLVVPFSSAEVEFDGYIDEELEPWTGDWIAIDMVKDDNVNANDGDYTSDFQIFHDNENILIAVKVSDDTEGTAANSYERDNIEMFFNMDPTYTEAAYQDGIWQFRAVRLEDEAMEAGLLHFDGSANVQSVLCVSPDFKFGTDDSGTEYIWEFAFPIAVLDQQGAFDGENLTFDIAVANGVDAARTGQHFWGNNSDTQWNNAAIFTPIALEQDGAAEKLSLVEGSAFVSNNVLKVKNVNGMVNVYSLVGSLVASANIDGQGTIDISALTSGMYIVKGSNLNVKVCK